VHLGKATVSVAGSDQKAPLQAVTFIRDWGAFVTRKLPDHTCFQMLLYHSFVQHTSSPERTLSMCFMAADIIPSAYQRRTIRAQLQAKVEGVLILKRKVEPHNARMVYSVQQSPLPLQILYLLRREAKSLGANTRRRFTLQLAFKFAFP
jgi:hypothetical protein